MGDDPLTTGQTDMYQGIQFTHAAAVKFILRYTDPYGAVWTTSEITSDLPGADSNTCASIQTALQRLPNMATSSLTINSNQLSVAAGNINPFTRKDYSGGTLGATLTDSGGMTTCIVFFPAAPGTTGWQPLLEIDFGDYSSSGHQPLSVGAASMTGTVVEHVPGSFATGALSRPLTELATCSNRGICGAETGQCRCYAGHKGLACELQEALV